MAKVTVQTSSRSGVDDTTILLFSEVGPGGTGNLVGTIDVDLHDEIPVLILEVLETGVTEDTSIVDEDVDAAESLDGSLDNLVTKLDAVVVGDSLATGGLDLVDDNIGCLDGRERHWLADAGSGLPRCRVGAGDPLRRSDEEIGCCSHTFVELPSPLKEPPRSLTTTLAPRAPKYRA